MAGITLAQAEVKLTEALAALSNALEAQEYRTGALGKRNADLTALQQNINFWEDKVKSLSETTSGARRVRTIPVGDSW